jgi:hypothetical protein
MRVLGRPHSPGPMPYARSDRDSLVRSQVAHNTPRMCPSTQGSRARYGVPLGQADRGLEPRLVDGGHLRGVGSQWCNRLPQIGRISVVGIVISQNPQKQGYVSGCVQRLREKTRR